jgi:hypothetical protein
VGGGTTILNQYANRSRKKRAKGHNYSWHCKRNNLNTGAEKQGHEKFAEDAEMANIPY